MVDAPEFLFFDAAFTLFEPYPSVGAVYAETARAHGVQVDPLQLDAAFFPAWKVRRDSIPRGVPPYGTTDAESRRFWRSVVEDAFRACGHELPADPYFDTLYDRFGSDACWRLYPETLQAIAYARSRGVRLGVLSNFDPRLRPLLRSLDVDGLFDVIAVSCELAVEKPVLPIYERAAALAGAARFAHVGDDLEADFHGPTAAGWRACLVHRRGPNPDDPALTWRGDLLAAVQAVLA